MCARAFGACALHVCVCGSIIARILRGLYVELVFLSARKNKQRFVVVVVLFLLALL